jgi:hypothetical protein
MEAHELPVIQRAETIGRRMFRTQKGARTRLIPASLTGFYSCL